MCVLLGVNPLVSKKPHQKISQPVSRQNHPAVSNPARTNNVADGKHWRGCDHRAVIIPGSRTPNPPIVPVGHLHRNLEALFGPRLKLGVRKFVEPAPLKLLAVSEGCCLVSQLAFWR